MLKSVLSKCEFFQSIIIISSPTEIIQPRNKTNIFVSITTFLLTRNESYFGGTGVLQIFQSKSQFYQIASLVAQLVKNLPAMRETQVRSLGWEDPLEKGKATHSRILAWRIPWGRKESDTTEQHSLHFIRSSMKYSSTNLNCAPHKTLN